MGHSNTFEVVRADQRLGNTVNENDMFNFISHSLKSTGASTALPYPTGITFAKSDHLRQLRKEIGPHATDIYDQAVIEIFGQEHINPITDNTFGDPENHDLKSCFTRQLTATDDDGVMLEI